MAPTALIWHQARLGKTGSFSCDIATQQYTALPVQGRLHLTPHQIDIHLLYFDPHCLEHAIAVLNAEEQRRAARFLFDKDRNLHQAAQGFLRMTLSRYADLAPADWTYTRNPYGKPAIANPGQTALQFNLSHSRGLVACAVSTCGAVGVDVEQARILSDLIGVSRSAYAGPELDDVLSQTGPAQEQRFFTYWTLKEAYIKGRGMGLSLPLQKFHYTRGPQHQWHLHCDPSLEDTGNDWLCHAVQLNSKDYLAFVVHK